MPRPSGPFFRTRRLGDEIGAAPARSGGKIGVRPMPGPQRMLDGRSRIGRALWNLGRTHGAGTAVASEIRRGFPPGHRRPWTTRTPARRRCPGSGDVTNRLDVRSAPTGHSAPGLKNRPGCPHGAGAHGRFFFEPHLVSEKRRRGAKTLKDGAAFGRAFLFCVRTRARIGRTFVKKTSA